MDAARRLVSRQPSSEDEEALAEAGIGKTELSADRAPSMADLHEAKVSLVVHKGLVNDRGLSCAPSCQAPYV